MSPSAAWAQKPHQRSSSRNNLIRLLKNNIRTILLAICVILLLSILADRHPPYHGGPGSSFITASDHASTAPACSKTDPGNPCPRVAKVTVLIEETHDLYAQALALQDLHNRRFGYQQFVLRERLLADDWSKPAYLQQLLLAELAKPPSERLEWLVWMPPDTTLLNPKVPLEIFLPPASEWEHIHIIVASDYKGLNNGIFFLRVHEWSVWLMNACLSTELVRPSLHVPPEDTAALAFWVNRERFRNNVMHVPQRWFDANAGYRGSSPDAVSDPEKPQTRFRAGSAREGDLLVRHIGMESQKLLEMQRWIDFAEKHPARWELDVADTNYPRELEAFWRNEAPRERKTQDKLNAKLAADAKMKKKTKKPAAATGGDHAAQQEPINPQAQAPI